jgi:hypothetical protein
MVSLQERKEPLVLKGGLTSTQTLGELFHLGTIGFHPDKRNSWQLTAKRSHFLVLSLMSQNQGLFCFRG